VKIRAHANMRFFIRFLLIGLFSFVWGLYSLYDAAIGYPNQRVRAHKYEEFQEQENFETKWINFARDQGWPLQNPGEPQSDVNIFYNYAMAAICTPLGILFMVRVLRARGRWIEGDDSGVRASWGPEFTYDRVMRLEKRKWKGKGIAKVFFESGGGTKQFVIDDFKFKRHPTDEILCQLEAKIDPGLITGGPPEASQEESELDQPTEVIQ
jgi:hypothetical protein